MADLPEWARAEARDLVSEHDLTAVVDYTTDSERAEAVIAAALAAVLAELDHLPT